MALTKVTGKGITCSAVTEDKLGTSAVTTNKIGPDAVTSAKINNGAVTADDLASTLDLSSKTVTLPSDVVADAKRPVQDNIALLGFKMAVNDGLTVFNLVDGVVDEFNDESGTDEAEGSNDLYCGTSDYYINSTTPDGGPLTNSAGFTMTTITEPDTSTAGTNPGYTTATPATYTVPCGTCSVGVYIWGAGGSGAGSAYPTTNGGGGGGFSSGNLSVTGGQSLKIIAGEGGARNSGSVGRAYFRGGVGFPAPNSGNGGGLSVVHTGCIPSYPVPAAFVPSLYMIAGSGGGGSASYGGSGGGLQGDVGRDQTEQTSAVGYSPVDFENGGGGDQEQGGQGGFAEASPTANSGELLIGGDGGSLPCQQGGGGGAGYYGGGGGTSHPQGYGGGGGGSAYIGSPLVSCGSTEEGGGSPVTRTGGGTTSPLYVACGPGTPVGNGDGGFGPQNPDYYAGGDGYVLITSASCASVTSTTIVSDTFTSTSVATSARIVVFEENVDTPTLNTDIIASVSRDGTNFTNATLSDSGYVTGSSGQRILTGQADISGQPSGQSMRWKLALANNTVKIHGVALQWS